MADRISPQQRSRVMAAVRSRNTAPEVYVRGRLHAAGFRFRLQNNHIPGRPDIVLPRFRIAVFVNGCFWHGHDCTRGKRPASNTEFWNAKIDQNVQRDRRVRKELHTSGWSYVTLWECTLEKGTIALLRRLKKLSLVGRAHVA